MTILKTYTQNNNEYILSTLSNENVDQHFADYINYIELSTNTSIPLDQKTGCIEGMFFAIETGVCVAVSKNGVTECFAYAHKASRNTLELHALHSYYLEPVPYSKIILLNHLYTQKEGLRFTSVDPWMLPVTSILKTSSLALIRGGRTRSIQCKRDIWDAKIMNFLAIKEI